MNYYSFGNPRGTSNSEYGRFSFFSNLNQGVSGSQSAYSLTGGQNASWNTQQGHHDANCRSQYRNQNQGNEHEGNLYQGGDDYSYDVDHSEHDTSVLEPNNTNSYPAAQQTSSAAEGCQHQESAEGSKLLDLSGGGGDQFHSNQPSTSADHGSLGGHADAEKLGNDSLPQESPPAVETVPKPKPAKWRGLPKRGDGHVKFGRHIPPTYSRQNQHPNQMRMPFNPHQQSQKYPYFGPGTNEMNANNFPGGNKNMTGKNTVSLTSLNRKEPTPTASNMSLIGSSMGNPVSSSKASLCGKCSKCKILLPPNLGPSTMTFPVKSNGLRKPSSRSLGQDAKNFRAIRYAGGIE